MLRFKVYGLWACIVYGFVGAASSTPKSSLVRKKIHSISVATCDSKILPTLGKKLYYLSDTGIAAIHFPRDERKKSEPKEIIALDFPEQLISALAVDETTKRFFMSSGSRLGEINFGDDVLEDFGDSEPDWHKPAEEAIDFYTPDIGGVISSPISILYLAANKELLFSASADKICRWSTRKRSLDAVQNQVAATLAMAVYDDKLFAVHANGDLQSVPLERDVAEHNATFNGKAMRLATFDESEQILYAVSQDKNLYVVDTRALQVTRTAEIKKVDMPIALAMKNHGLFIGYERGAIKFYDVRRLDKKVGSVTAGGESSTIRVGRVAEDGSDLRQLWYDRAKHSLVSLSAANEVRRYWIE